MRDLPVQLRQAIEQQKQEGTRFNSLVIGDVFMSEKLKTLFDKEWVYNPRTHHIHEVVGFAKEFGGGAVKIMNQYRINFKELYQVHDSLLFFAHPKKLIQIF